MLGKKLALFALPLAMTLSLQAQNPLNDPFFNDPFGDDIFNEMMQMQKNMDKMFSRMQNRMQQRSSGLVSPLGTYKMAVRNQFEDKGDHYILVTNIPESKENHVDINTKDGVMSVSAKIVQKRENKTNHMINSSSSVQMYQQRMPLPQDADENTIKVEYQNGQMVIWVGKLKSSALKHVTSKPTAVKTVEKKEEVKEIKKSEAKTDDIKTDDTKKEDTGNTKVEITKEFDQTPEKPELKEK